LSQYFFTYDAVAVDGSNTYSVNLVGFNLRATITPRRYPEVVINRSTVQDEDFAAELENLAVAHQSLCSREVQANPVFVDRRQWGSRVDSLP
jgi:hypothetical protein